MKKIIFLFVAIFSFIACNNDENDSPNLSFNSNKDVSIVNGILKFKNQEVFDSIKDAYLNGNEKSVLSDLKLLGHVSISDILFEADKELEQICETSEEQDFKIKYADFKAKYSEKFIFNLDEEDLSPYIPYVNSIEQFFANCDGKYMIGEKVIKADAYSDYAELKQDKYSSPIMSRAVSEEGNSLNHAWSHQSKRKVSLYLTIEGSAVWAEFKSQKKNVFGWVRYSTVYHGKFKLDGGFVHYYNTPNGLAKDDQNNREWQWNFGEQGGTYKCIIGHVNYNSGPVRCPYRTSGWIECWSRGVSYEDRGRSRVDLCN